MAPASLVPMEVLARVVKLESTKPRQETTPAASAALANFQLQ